MPSRTARTGSLQDGFVQVQRSSTQVITPDALET